MRRFSHEARASEPMDSRKTRPQNCSVKVPYSQRSKTTPIDFHVVQNFSRMSFDLISVETEAIMACDSRRYLIRFFRRYLELSSPRDARSERNCWRAAVI